jgi:hypothetical protein
MGMMAGLLAILGYGVQINRLAKWPLESSLLFVCASLICLLYVSGLLGCLQITAQALLGIGVLLFLAGVISQWRSGTISQSMSPGVWFFLLSAIGIWLLTRSEYYSNFVFVDDFSHWGRISKIIADNDRLIITTDPIWYQDYPPGMALFDYLFFQFSGFRENNAMFAHGVFIFAAFAQIFSIFSKPVNRYAFLGVSIFICSLIYFFGQGLHTLSVDLIVGVVFGVAVFGYLEDSQNGRLASVIRLIPLVMVLPLIKQIGILFSFVIVSIVVCDFIFASISGREKIKLIFAALTLFAMSILTYASWGEHIKNMGVQKTFNTEMSLGVVVKAFIPASATERQKTTIDNFTHRVFLPHAESKVSRQYYWFALCLSFLWLIWYTGEDRKSRVRFVPYVVLFGGFCAYLGILLVLYLFSFGAYEGPRLVSFDRYVNTYLIGVLIVLFGVALSQLFKEKRGRTATISIITICLLVAIPNLKAELLDVFHVARGEINGQQNRDIERVAKYWKVIESKTTPDSRIYFVWQGSNGTENTIFNYGIMPRRSNRGCWSVGEPYTEGDVWTCRMTTSEFEQVLMDYDYVLVAHSDKNFADRFFPLFGFEIAQEGSLFQVVREAERIRLHRI